MEKDSEDTWKNFLRASHSSQEYMSLIGLLTHLYFMWEQMITLQSSTFLESILRDVQEEYHSPPSTAMIPELAKRSSAVEFVC
ncbi:hypothetical protein OUZ56_005392 [Daphnia magna]|uniref:Uncharacterized protein n=1 Tax=Daphnia magna TaxID=35525 RepID=A0ABQ9YSP0_9CRUS|nr:hypothetical protein OUZ56_005392 [Daphnia magna]